MRDIKKTSDAFKFERDDLKENLRKTFLDGNRKLKFMVEEGRNFSARRGGTYKALPITLSPILTQRFRRGGDCSSHVMEQGEGGKLYVHRIV